MMGLFLTCLLTYTVFFSGHHYSIDGIVMFQNAKSILFQGSFVMNPPVRWGMDIKVGHWGTGLSLAYTPILAILASTIFSGNDQIHQIPYDPDSAASRALLVNDPYLFSSFLNPVLTAVTALILFSLSLRLGFSVKKGCAVALVFGLASPAAVYSKFDFAQPLASLLLLLAVFFLLREEGRFFLNFSLAGTFLGCAIVTRPEFAIIAIPVFVLMVCLIQPCADKGKKRSTWRPLWKLAAFGLPVIGLLLINQYINFLRFGYWSSLGYDVGREFSLIPFAIGTALAGNLISPGRGILLYFPLSLLSAVGLRRLFLINRFAAATFATLIILSMMVYSMYGSWGAGICWGPRLFIPIMPYLTLLAFLGYDSLQQLPKRFRVSLATLLITLGAMIALQGFLFNPLDFFSGLNLAFKTDSYQFVLQYSPIFAGWTDIVHPSRYDIYWLQRFISNHGRSLWVLLFGFAGLGFAVKSWLDFFFREGSY